MPYPVSTRPATTADLSIVYELICDMQERTLDPQAFEQVYVEYLLRHDVRCMVAEVSGKTVGVICLHFQNHLHHAGRIAEVVELAVSEAYRSGGIGARLLAEAEIAAVKEGCQVLELSTNQRRVKAHAFYKKEGMECSHFKFTKNL
jgi:(aminoalkyl)phosphonate N-acetyltransferase